MNRNMLQSPAIITALIALVAWLGLRYLLPAVEAPKEALALMVQAPSLLFMIYLPFMAINLFRHFQGLPAIAQDFMMYCGAAIGGLLLASGGWTIVTLFLGGFVTLDNPASIANLLNPLVTLVLG